MNFSSKVTSYCNDFPIQCFTLLETATLTLISHPIITVFMIIWNTAKHDEYECICYTHTTDIFIMKEPAHFRFWKLTLIYTKLIHNQYKNVLYSVYSIYLLSLNPSMYTYHMVERHIVHMQHFELHVSRISIFSRICIWQ